MSQTNFTPHLVNLQKREEAIIQRCVEEKGLGGKGFSAAVRLIIHEWDAYQRMMDFADREYWLGSEE